MVHKSYKDVRGFIPLTKQPVELFPVNQDGHVASDYAAENSVRHAALLVHCGSPYYGHYSGGNFWGNFPAG